MTAFFNPFATRATGANSWFRAGPSSAFPNITNDDDRARLIDARPCASSGQSGRPGCKIFHVPPGQDVAAATEVTSDFAEASDTETARGLRDQVLVFQYKGQFHAVEHACPHSSYPLCNGTAFDVEDFGIVWSAGITCPKHGWAFDLASGRSDRGNYQLKKWEVELREPAASLAAAGGGEKEVWVRRKQRMG